MTCRHAPGDPACGAGARSYAADRIRELENQVKSVTPDSKNYWSAHDSAPTTFMEKFWQLKNISILY